MDQKKQGWVWILAILAVLLVAGSFGGYHMIGFGFGFGWIFMLLFWGLLIWLVFTLIGNTQSTRKQEDAQEILKRRYAKGEITKKQYGEMKKELRD